MQWGLSWPTIIRVARFEPSNEDSLLTSKLKAACELVGLNLTDHITVGNGKYTSFMDRR